MTRQRPPPRLYLVTPALADDAATFAHDIGTVLEAADVAAVLMRLEDADKRTLINRAKAVAAEVQKRDVALLLDSRPELAARVDADGAHLFGIEAFNAAAGSLKPDRIAGVGGLRGRHDAMLAGEASADYVMFGDPDRRGSRPPLDAILEQIEWWAELLQPACVGYAASQDEIRPLAQAGADFIALGDWIWTDPKGAAATVAAAAEQLVHPPPRSAA